jgi:hypothetical protein
MPLKFCGIEVNNSEAHDRALSITTFGVSQLIIMLINKYRNLRTQQMLVHSIVAYGGFYTYWLIHAQQDA